MSPRSEADILHARVPGEAWTFLGTSCACITDLIRSIERAGHPKARGAADCVSLHTRARVIVLLCYYVFGVISNTVYSILAPNDTIIKTKIT